MGLITASATLLVFHFASRRRRMGTREVARGEFIRIMTRLSESVFLILFEYCQVAARVEAASGHRQPFDPVKKLKREDPHLHKILIESQSSILHSEQVDESSLIATQDRMVPQDSEVAVLVNVIPAMITAYQEGRFPVLPEPFWNRLSKSDDEILGDIRTSFESNIAEPSELRNPAQEISIGVRNLICMRINESDDFKIKLLQVVTEAQTKMRNRLA